MRTLRTPDERFAELQDYPFSPNYLDVEDGEGGSLRVHYVDEGPRDGQVILLMHGEPSWSYLYRKMITPLAEAGYRLLAPDLIGFGRSDKPAEQDDYSYQRHVDWMTQWLDAVGVSDINLFCQDWGGLIGLRLVAGNPDVFARVAVANTGLPIGNMKISEAFMAWRKFSQESPDFNIGEIVQGGCRSKLPPGVIAAYDAPFPDDSYKQGARIFPSLVPISLDDPAAAANKAAWEVLSRFRKPFLTAFSDQDPITRGGERIFQSKVPGAVGRRHVTIEGAGHFLQEDCPGELVQVLIDFISTT